ncbi:MAG: oligosaccharide flippase family protein [Bacteroidaceae bacterium]|nr:oligosaccharide flippase family protein [Bacteroidaceae bacterium]
MAENTPNTHVDSSSESDATYDHVIKYTGLFGGVQGITMLVSIVRNKIVSEFLGPSGLALINLFNNAIRLIHQSTDFGISFSAVKHVAELFERGTEEEIQHFVRTVRTWCLCAGLLGMMVCLALCRQISCWTFEHDGYTWHFAVLSLVVGMLAVQGGEIAILKGMKQLKKVALIAVFGAISTLVISAPIYYFWRIEGIVCSLVLCNAAVLAIHLCYSSRLMPWRVSLFSKDEYAKGIPMVKLGLGFIIAGIFGQGAEYIIRALILRFGELADVGLYTSGYTLAVSYANIVFVAFEADYFPRLSASQHDLKRMNQTVNQQIEVGVLLMAPLLTCFVLAMPVIVPLLFSSEFVDAVPMAICASFFMFFKALTLPTAYLALAKGDSLMYMMTELVYDIFIAIAIPFAFKYWGLEGAGWALSVAGLLDMLLIHTAYAISYGYRFDFRRAKIYLLQFVCFTVAVVTALHANPWMKLITGVALVVSALISFHVLKNETQVLSKLKKRLWRK